MTTVKQMLDKVQTIEGVQDVANKINNIKAHLVDGEDYTNWAMEQLPGCTAFIEVEYDSGTKKRKPTGQIVACINAPESRRPDFDRNEDGVHVVMLGD